MKAVMKRQPKPGIIVGDMAEPKINPDEVLIKVKAVGICGSDVHVYEWSPGYEHIAKYLPVVLGHEFAGEVAEIGKQVCGVKVGDRVVYQSGSCGHCFYCNTSQHSLCEERMSAGRLGMERNGGMSEYVAVNVRQNFLPQIIEGISFEEAAQCHPSAEALHMLEKAPVFPGDPVVVLGAGPIALTVAQAAKSAGADPVIVTGLSRDQMRLALAKSLGADAIIDVEKRDPVAEVKALTGGLGTPRVFEVSGSQKAFVQGLEMLQKGGTMVAFGIHSQEVSIDATRRLIREMKVIRGVFGASRSAWSRVMKLIATKQIQVAPLITHRLPLEQAEEGFRACAEKMATRVILLPEGS